MSGSNLRSAATFFALVYLVAWAFFVPVVAAGTPTVTAAQTLLVTFGAISPAFVAVLLTAREQGRAGVARLLARIVRWRVAAGWYLFAALYMVTLKLTSAVFHRMLLGTWPHIETAHLILIPFAIAISTPVQAGEELGWRGYALPRLAAWLGMGGASLLLGAIWALWHLPLFFLRGADTYGQSFFVYALQVIAFSVTFAWVYAKTGSLLPVMLLHAAINNSKDIVPAALPGASNTFTLVAAPISWITLALSGLVAAAMLLRMPRALAEPPPE